MLEHKSMLEMDVKVIPLQLLECSYANFSRNLLPRPHFDLSFENIAICAFWSSDTGHSPLQES